MKYCSPTICLHTRYCDTSKEVSRRQEARGEGGASARRAIDLKPSLSACGPCSYLWVHNTTFSMDIPS